MVFMIWIDGAIVLCPGILGFVVAYVISRSLPRKGRGIFALLIPVIALCFVLLASPNEVARIVEWVIAVSAMVGLELGVGTYSLLHRDPRKTTQPQQYLS